MNDNTAWIIVLLPLVGFLLQTFVGGVLLRGASTSRSRLLLGVLAILPLVAGFVLSLSLYETAATIAEGARSTIVPGPDWISIGGLSIPFELRVDPLSITMTLVITGIGALIHLYSMGYMGGDRDYSRFFAYLNLFIAAMLMLVLGNNLLLLFIGWEGVGLCSYLLIGFWYEDASNVRAANKAFIVNRIGDWGLLLGIFLIVATLGAAGRLEGRFLSYDAMLPALAQAVKGQPMLATAIALLLFVGAAGKSAQFPLHIWLPDAMAGPTPVSALIHAATMVTSGIVLLNRMNVVFLASPIASAVVCGVAAFTALYAAVVAFGQTDIKKVLAWSTVSQLGFMFFACGAGAFGAGMFHVVTHAFFKALLFLGAGAVIHAMAHEQDMRRYGRLWKSLPVTFFTMLLGTLAISGVPIWAGFYSKEAAIGGAMAGDRAIVGGVNVGLISGWVGLFVALLTAIYMMRLMMLTFGGKTERWRDLPAHAVAPTGSEDDPHGDAGQGHDHGLDRDHKPHEVGLSMAIPLIVLAILSTLGGFVMNNGEAFLKWISSGPDLAPVAELHPHSIPLVPLSLAAALGGLAIGYIVYAKGLPVREGEDESKWSPWRRAARDQFGFDRALGSAAIEGGGNLSRGLDRGVEGSLVGGGYGGVIAGYGLAGRALRTLQSGYARAYAVVMLLGVCGLAAWIVTMAGRSGR
ncbi:NADH-quinone oxidoreductase subunit L [bacterium]|nr:MAG: NADH-quinone oxidoreductase subunit L [bacterium]